MRTKLASWIVGAFCGVVYLLTQAPGLMYTDTGELAAAAYTWGVAHPTGYPLLTLIGHAWSMLPWPSVIGGLNVLTALLTAAGVGLVTAILLRLFPNRSAEWPWIQLATGLLFGLSELVWAQSTAFEVYGLNLLLSSACILATLVARDSDRIGYTALAGTIFGLGLANHLSMVFISPGLLLLWYKSNRPKAFWLTLFAPMLVGLSLYAILPLRSASLPPINWGWVHRGFDEFLYHVKGTQFGVWMFSDSKTVPINLNIFFRESTRMLLWIGWLPVVFGVVDLFRSARNVALGLLAILAGNLMVSTGYAIPDIEPYFLPSMLVFVLFLGYGLFRLLRSTPWYVQGALLVLPITALIVNVKSMNYRNHRAVEAYADFMWSNLEPDAIVITRQWDFVASAMWYQQTVEHRRPDVAVIDKELMRRTWYLPHLAHLYPAVMKGARGAVAEYMPWLRSFERDGDAFMKTASNPENIQRRFIAVLNAILDSNSSRPLYATPEIVSEERGFAPGYRAIPVGPVYRLTRDSTLRVHTRVNGLDLLQSSLANRYTRLDSALRGTVMGILAADAIYAYTFLADTAVARNLRDRTVAIDPKHSIARTIISRIP